MKNTTVALLALALALQASADVHLLPTGEFVGRDGRPGKGLTWKLSDAQGRDLAARLNARHSRVQFNLDYEHQAMLAEQNGQPAPASGWASAFEWRSGVGLFALNVQWTARAKEMIEAGEYKYISPVISYDGKTGAVVDVLNASLVNIPCLDLNPVAQERVARLNASFSTPPTEQSMNPVLKALLKALGLPETEATTAEQAVGAVASLKAGATAVPAAVVKALGLPDAATEVEAATAAAALKAGADKAAGLTTEIATLKAGGNPDPSKWVALDKFTELSTQVAQLALSSVDRQVDELLSEARAQGKCSAVVEGVWRDVGKNNIAQLKALIEKTPANPVLAGLSQTAGKNIGKIDPNATPTADELAMCKNMGLTVEQFRAGAVVAA